MSKKDRLAMLSGLMGPENPETSATPLSKRPALPRRGAIGAISSAVSGLRAAGVIEIEPDRIRDGGLPDRIEIDIEDDTELRRSIETHGQQVPILVRPHPEDEGFWQIVYGRRRVHAARDLGISVKALVRDLDDAALVMAQGQENSARRDLSFIEKASFARQMAKAGYERSTICDALSADKTLVSRMLSTVDRIPEDVIRAIGAAHGVGRPRWIELADLLDSLEISAKDAAAVLSEASDMDSSARFRFLLQKLKQKQVRKKADVGGAIEIRSSQGEPIAQAVQNGRKKRLAISVLSDDGFGDWLVTQLPEIHARWAKDVGSE